jgi:hypothetical protein
MWIHKHDISCESILSCHVWAATQKLEVMCGRVFILVIGIFIFDKLDDIEINCHFKNGFDFNYGQIFNL